MSPARKTIASDFEFPWLAVLALQHVAGFRLLCGFALRIPVEAELAAIGHVAQDGGGSRVMTDLDVAIGPLPRLDAVDKVLPVVLESVVRPLRLHGLERRVLLRH